MDTRARRGAPSSSWTPLPTVTVGSVGADIGTLGKCLFPGAKALSSGLDCKAVSKSNTLWIDTCHPHMLFKRLG